MKGKIIIGSILAVLLLVTISYATAINTKDIEEKESPLYKLRTRLAISEKISNIIDNIETNFLGSRIFCIPLSLRLYDQVGRTMYFTECGGDCTFFPANKCQFVAKWIIK